QIQLQQCGSDLQRPGASGKLSCKNSYFSFRRQFLSSYCMSWVKKRPEQGMEWIGYINLYSGDTSYNQKFKEKATLSTDTSSKTAYMQLSSLVSEDSVVYYCARHSVVTTS
uniref:Ig-like domain-containing protein n=1 Tax=Rattus norvegicus TaxID=10116 RepID=A0ABK0LPR8_RAT